MNVTRVARARGFAAGRFAFELDGTQAGWLESASGGDAEGDVVQEQPGADHVVRKHLGSVRYSDVVLEAGAGMEKAFYEWIGASLAHTYQRKDGAVVSVDQNLKEVARLAFFNALITEVTFPALDAASKDPAALTVTVAPEYARTNKGSGAKVSGSQGAKAQKKWLPSNFRLQIDGVDCKKVNAIEALTIKQKVVESPVGETRDYVKEPARLEIGDLVVTVAESGATDFIAWHDDFVVKGNNGEAAEKTGKLELLTPDLKTALFTLDFAGLGIFKLRREPQAGGGGDSVARLRASIYCEELTFTG
jgi:phage tail-like protein